MLYTVGKLFEVSCEVTLNFHSFRHPLPARQTLTSGKATLNLFQLVSAGLTWPVTNRTGKLLRHVTNKTFTYQCSRKNFYKFDVLSDLLMIFQHVLT